MAEVAPRGLRNNNPFNLKEIEGDKTQWKGERATDDDPIFEEFENPEAGIRAGIKVLKTYQSKHGIKTITGIVERFAPSSENDVAAYIASVAQRSGFTADEELDLSDPRQLSKIVDAIIFHENGKQPFPEDIIKHLTGDITATPTVSEEDLKPVEPISIKDKLDTQIQDTLGRVYEGRGNKPDAWKGVPEFNVVSGSDEDVISEDNEYKANNMTARSDFMSEEEQLTTAYSLQAGLDGDFGNGAFKVDPQSGGIHVAGGDFAQDVSPLPTLPPVRTENRKNEIDGNELADVALDGRDPTDVPTINVKSEAELDAFISQKRDTAIRDEQAQTTARLNKAVELAPATIVPTLPWLRERLAGGQASAESVTTLEAFKAQLRVNDVDGKLTEAQIGRSAAIQYASYALAQSGDTNSVPSKVLGTTGFIFWPEMGLNMGSVFGVNAGINTAGFTQDFAKQFTNLSPKEQVFIIDELINDFGNVDNNTIRTIAQMTDLIGQGTSFRSQNAINLFEKVDVLTLGAVGLTFGTKIFTAKRVLSQVKTLADTNPEASAKLIESGLKDSNTNGKMGTLLVELANAGDSNKVPGILVGSPDNITATVRNKWNRISQEELALDEVLDEGLGLTSVQKDGVVAKEIDKLMKEVPENGIIPDSVVGRWDGNTIKIEYKEARVEPWPQLGWVDNIEVSLSKLGGDELSKTSPTNKVISGDWWSGSEEALKVMTARVSGIVGSGVKHFETPDDLVKYLKRHGSFKGEHVKAIDPNKIRKSLRKDQVTLATFGKSFDAQDLFPIRSNNAVVLDSDVNFHVVKQANSYLFPRDRTIPTRVVHKGTMKRQFTVDDINGQFVDEELHGSLVSKAVSPIIRFGNDLGSLVAPFVRILNANAKSKGVLFKSYNIALEGMNRSSLKKLDHVLRQGDMNSAVYTHKQLVTDGLGGVRLTDKEFVAYAGVRRVVDDMWTLENVSTRKGLTSLGIRSIKHNGAVVLGKKFDTPETAAAALRGSEKFKKVLIQRTGKDELLSDLDVNDMKKFYTDNYVLTRAMDQTDNLFKSGKTNTGWKLVKKEDVRDLPTIVLNKYKGYIPRISKDTNWFLKERVVRNIDGVDQEIAGSRTAASATTKKEIDQIQLDIEAQLDAGSLGTKRYEAVPDGALSQFDMDMEGVAKFGGLFNSPRAITPPPHGLAGGLPPYEDVFSSIQRGVNHIATKMNATEYRHGIEKIWMNTAKQYIPKLRHKNMLFDDALHEVEKSGISPIVKNKLVAAGEQIQYMNKVPTSGEQTFKGSIRAIAKGFEGMPNVLGGDKISRLIYRMDSSDPVNALKGATFNLALGMYNHAQIFIQAAGATIAMSINPVHAARALPIWLAASTLDNIPNPQTRIKIIQAMKASDNSLYANLGEEYALWQRTGMREGIIHTDSNMAQAFRGNPLNPTLFGKFVRGGQYAYKAGELINSRVSFFTALKRWKSLNKGKKIDDDAFKAILERTEVYRLNMSSANKAELQKGWTSAMTQFLAVNVRFVEALSGKQLTAWEKVSLTVGQGMFFGLLGIPAADYFVQQAMDQFDVNPNDLPIADYEELRTGAIGLMFGGMDVDIVSRMALSNGFTDIMLETLFSEEAMPAMFLGASWNVTVKPVGRAIEDFWNIRSQVLSADEVDIDVAHLVVAEAITAVLDVPKGLRSMMAAHIALNESVFTDRHGAPMMLKGESTLAETFWHAVGLSPMSVMEEYTSRESEQNNQDLKREIVNMYTRSLSRLVRIAGSDERKQVKAMQMWIGSIDRAFVNPQDRALIKKAVRDNFRIETGVGGATEAARIIQQWGSDLLTPASKFNGNVLKFSGGEEE